MKNKLLFISVALLCCEAAWADNYAILISAGKATSDNKMINSENWFDLYLIYEYLLLEEYYDSAKVFVFYGDGYDYNTSVDRYRKELHNWGQITDYDNSYSSLFTVIPSLNSVITEDDNLLFYWVVGHGFKNDSSDDSYQAYVSNAPDNPNDPNAFFINKVDLLALINSITHYNRRKIIWMTCHSGAMGAGSINPLNNNTTLIASCSPDELSYSHVFNMGNTNYYHSCFNYALFSLSTGHFPSGIGCNYNQYYYSGVAMEDSLLSVNELHSGIGTFVGNIPYMNNQHPCLFDSGCISGKIFLGENKGIKNVTINNNSSYWLDRMEISDVTLGSGIDVSIDVDVQSVIKKNTFVPVGTTLILK